ncbi:unnamed protein product, partial [Didymodactylos carnosus]
MPTVLPPISEPTAANEKIGGVPILHYFDFGSKGRGEVLRLFFYDAEISFIDKRYTFQEFPEYQKSIIVPKMNPTGSIPIVELNDEFLTQSAPVLRLFSYRLDGAYNGTTPETTYWVDAMADIVIDFRALFAKAYFAEDKTEFEEHLKKDVPKYLVVFEKHLKKYGGPFFIGKEITYADFMLWQVIHDDGLLKGNGLDGYPLMQMHANALMKRPNIKKYFASD